MEGFVEGLCGEEGQLLIIGPVIASVWQFRHRWRNCVVRDRSRGAVLCTLTMWRIVERERD
jgi:hypothetical protein